MKTNSSIIAIFLFYCIFQLPSCGNYFSDECDYILEAPQEFLDYWYFPDGSWWVYQLNDTIIDTVTISTSKTHYDKDDLTDINGSCVYIYNAYFNHSSRHKFTSACNTSSISSINLNNETWMINGGSLCSNYWYLGKMLKYPIKIGDTISYYKMGNDVRFKFIFDYIKDSLIFNTLTDIIKIKNIHEGNRPDLLYESYAIAKDIGIVEIKYFNQEEIKLLDYKINK
jgi:hypothetical protein